MDYTGSGTARLGAHSENSANGLTTTPVFGTHLTLRPGPTRQYTYVRTYMDTRYWSTAKLQFGSDGKDTAPQSCRKRRRASVSCLAGARQNTRVRIPNIYLLDPYRGQDSV